MCGIAGHVASADAGRAPREARRWCGAMVAALHHRGPDAAGVHQSGPATLGHTRLSIIDLSTDANQPMLSADGQVVLVFNGEIYNFRELRRRAARRGRHAAHAVDTEVLLRAVSRCTAPSFVEQDARHVRVRDLGRAQAAARARARSPAARSRSSSHRQARACRSRRSCRRCSPTATSSDAPIRAAMHAYLALGYVPTDFAAIAGVRKLAPGTHRGVRGRQARRGALLERCASRRSSGRRRTSSRSCATTCSRR